MKNNILFALAALFLITAISSCGVQKKYMTDAFDLLKTTFPDAKTKMVDGKVQILFPNNDMFDVGSSVLKPKFEERVTKFSEILNKYPDTKMHIVGHTDNTGDKAKNMTLSEDRALHVLESFVSHSVAKDRLDSHGEGQANPIATNDTEAGRAENRRVAFEMYYAK